MLSKKQNDYLYSRENLERIKQYYFKKGHISYNKDKKLHYNVWNKGKKLHYSVWNKDLRGYKMPKASETKKRLFKEGKLINPMQGRHHTEEARKEMSKIKLKGLKEGKIKPTRYWLGKHHSEEYKKKMSEKLKGENAPNWKGGIIPESEKRCNEREWRRIRKEIYKRDNYECVVCSKHGGKLQCHHIIPYRISRDNSFRNLLTMCLPCHTWVERNLTK